jgi:cell division protein FtsI/penicillin-binding protein 2
LAHALTPQKKKKSARTAMKRVASKNVAFNVARTPKARKPKPVRDGRWRVPNFAESTDGDFIDGEDLVVRRAAVNALGPMNGTVVVTDPGTGRVLTMVNQQLALKGGFQPCSTIKLPVALAALSENIIERTTMIRVYGRTSFNLTSALAKSNNQYFASLGQKLGFDRVSYYARLFGLGEKAGLDIEGEQPGTLPASVPRSGIGMMTSFGDGIALTPLELAALVGAVANGGTLYYLQYPKTQQEAQALIPQVKRRLDIEEWIPEIKPGMMGAVEYGTARRVGFDPNEPVYGKTGTCTDERSPTHLGWFGSFTELGKNKLVVVVLLTGGRLVSGPTASGVAGEFYKNLDASNYFAKRAAGAPIAMMTPRR